MLSHNSQMSRRRSRTDAVEISREPRWLVVRDRLSHPVEYRARSVGSDLSAAVAAKQAELAAAGWRVDSIPNKCGFFFAGRENDRVCVAIECFEPASSAAIGRGR